MASIRPRRLPSAVATHLARADRVLAAAPLAEGQAWAVATRKALTVVDPDAIQWRRAWHEVDHASWDEAAGSIAIRWVEGDESRLALAEGTSRTFPDVVRERVQSSVVHVERLVLSGGVTVRAVIRREEDGTLLSQVLADGAVGGSDEDADAILALEERARRAVGLPG
jgi:hypothetical protein